MKWVAITTPCMCVFSSSLYSETGTKNTIKNKSGKEKNKGEKVTHLHTRMFRAELFGVCLYGFLVTHAIEDFQCISYRPWRVAVAAALDWLGLTYKRQHLAKQKKNKNTRIKKKGNATEAANPGNQREKKKLTRSIWGREESYYSLGDSIYAFPIGYDCSTMASQSKRRKICSTYVQVEFSLYENN